MENRKLDWASRANEAVGVVNAQAGLDDKGEGGSRCQWLGMKRGNKWRKVPPGRGAAMVFSAAIRYNN